MYSQYIDIYNINDQMLFWGFAISLLPYIYIVQTWPAVLSSLKDMWTVDRLSLFPPICSWNPFKSNALSFWVPYKHHAGKLLRRMSSHTLWSWQDSAAKTAVTLLFSTLLWQQFKWLENVAILFFDLYKIYYFACLRDYLFEACQWQCKVGFGCL